MRIRIDAERCQGHNRCYAIAPELVDVDDYGTAHPVHEGDLPPELNERAALIVDNCPEYAIEIVTDP